MPRSCMSNLLPPMKISTIGSIPHKQSRAPHEEVLVIQHCAHVVVDDDVLHDVGLVARHVS